MTPVRLVQFTIIVLLLNCSIASAQKQSNIWYFGSRAGLDFNQTPVKALNDGVIDTFEGSASIADANGSLLFYADGTTIWNKKHQIMVNGNNLTGNASSTQSGVIVPAPSNANLYYVFTVGMQGGTLDYSVVDITKDNGFGEVITKNLRLLTLSTEKITAVKHNNGRDIWVIGHELYNNKFYAWLVTPNGIATSPVVTAAGSQHGNNFDNVAAIGYMKASPDGSKIALGARNSGGSFAETLDFDTKTGVLSNPTTLTGFGNILIVYGIEFSADGKLLYVLEENYNNNRLFQVKLPYTTGAITQKGTLIASNLFLGALQICPDGRIIVSQAYTRYLDVINFPSVEGVGCNYVKKVIDLETGRGNAGLPTFIQSFFNAFSFSASSICFNSTTNFTLVSAENNFDQITWDFGEPSSGTSNTSSLRNPVHRYQQPGDYEVNLTVRKGSNVSSISQTVTISSLPNAELPADTTLFYGQTLTLDVGSTGNTYLWNNGSTAPNLTVTSPGTYSVTVANSAGCTATDEIKVTYDQIITSGLPPEALLCRGSSITLDVTLPGASYLWSNGSTGPSLTVNTAGRYSVTIINAYNNRRRTDQIEVKFKEFALPALPVKTVLCEPGIATITATGATAGQFYNWYDENKVFIEQNSGTFKTGFLNAGKTYYAAVTDGGCSGEMQSTFVQLDKPYAKINAQSTVIKVGETFTFTGEGGAGYLWSGDRILTSETDQTIVAQPLKNTTYKLITTNENGCLAEAEIKVIVKTEFDIPNTFTPNGDGINDTWIIPYINYVNSTLKVYNRQGQLVYSVTNYKNNWDGTSDGKVLPWGAYYYVIVANQNTTISGNINIVK